MSAFRILFADPDPSTRGLLAEAFRRRRIRARVAGAHTCADALDRLMKDDYDILVCDRSLPDLVPDLFLQQAREAQQNLSIFMLLPEEDTDFASRVRASGSVEVILRPGEIEVLCELLEAARASRPPVPQEPDPREQRPGNAAAGGAPGPVPERLPGRTGTAWLASLPGAGPASLSGPLPVDPGLRDPDRLGSLLEDSGALLFVLDPEGRVVLFNKACQALTGYSPHEVQGKPLWEGPLVQEEAEIYREAFGRSDEGKGPRRLEGHWYARDGTRKAIAWSIWAMPAEEGQVRRVAGLGLERLGGPPPAPNATGGPDRSGPAPG